MRLHPVHPEPVHKGERALVLPATELVHLRQAVADIAGAQAGAELLFGLGQRLGQRTAEHLVERGMAGRTAMEQGLRRLEQLGLGRARLSDFTCDLEQGQCRARGRLRDPVAGATCGQDTPGDAAMCELSVGYLTGLAAGITGLDVVCSPFQCSGPCHADGCAFDIGPAHRQDSHGGDGAPPSGSARFFLRTLGRQLAEADLSLDELVENSADAVVLADERGVIRFWNRTAERMFGLARELAVGRNLEFLLPDDLRLGNETTWIGAALQQHGAVRHHITRRLAADGRELWVSLGCAPLHDSHGKAIGTSTTLRDITAQRRTEQELARARGLALVGELAAKVAHEIKNPLAGIYAAVQLLSRDVEGQRRAVFDSVGAEIRRLDETVQDLLRFALPAPPRKHRADLRTFVRELLESLQLHPDLQGRAIAIHIPEGLIVAFDARLLGQVLTNLLLNAGQALLAGGSIDLDARMQGPLVHIEVADDGPGIAAQDLARIFDPFVTTKIRGTGLGLSIARQNVEAHGGRLEVENRAAGGALFRVLLPAAG